MGAYLAEALNLLNEVRKRHRRLHAFLAQSEGYRVLLVEPAVKAAGGRWGVVLEGEFELPQGEGSRIVTCGERFFSPDGAQRDWGHLHQLF